MILPLIMTHQLWITAIKMDMIPMRETLNRGIKPQAMTVGVLELPARSSSKPHPQLSHQGAYQVRGHHWINQTSLELPLGLSQVSQVS